MSYVKGLYKMSYNNSKRQYGPRWGQTNKWGKYKCTTPTVANGGIKNTKKNKSNSDKN